MATQDPLHVQGSCYPSGRIVRHAVPGCNFRDCRAANGAGEFGPVDEKCMGRIAGIPVRLAQESIDKLADKLADKIAIYASAGLRDRFQQYVKEILAEACHVLRPQPGDIVVFKLDRDDNVALHYVQTALRDLLQRGGHNSNVGIAVLKPGQELECRREMFGPIDGSRLKDQGAKTVLFKTVLFNGKLMTEQEAKDELKKLTLPPRTEPAKEEESWRNRAPLF